jgi:hypothetical protein
MSLRHRESQRRICCHPDLRSPKSGGEGAKGAWIPLFARLNRTIPYTQVKKTQNRGIKDQIKA